MQTDKYGPQKKYSAKAVRRFRLDLNRNTDMDMISYLEAMDNVQGYLKELIKADMQKGGE